MKLQISRWILLAGMVLGVVLCLLGNWNGNRVPIYLGIGVFVVSFLQAAVFYRCPHCGRMLDTKGLRPEYCPHCGEKLPWKE